MILFPSSAEAEIVDQVIATVGQQPILRSELQAACAMSPRDGLVDTNQLECKVLNELVMSKMLLYKAWQEDICVADFEVDLALNMRLNQLAHMDVSLESVAANWGGDVPAFKRHLKKTIREQMIIQRAGEKICKDLQATPQEVRSWFDGVPERERPYYPSEVVVQQLWMYPTIQPAEKERIKEQLEVLRQQCLRNTSLRQVAEDYPKLGAVVVRNGLLGTAGSNSFEMQYESVIRKLKPGQIAPPMLTPQGGYLIQLLSREGRAYQSQHMLMRPDPAAQDLLSARSYMEDVRLSIACNEVTFEDAITSFPKLCIPSIAETNSTPVAKDQLPPDIFFVLEGLAPDRVSHPHDVQDDQGCQAVRLLTYTVCVPAHEANLGQDYSKIKEAFLLQKKQKAIETWFEHALKEVPIKILSDYMHCNLQN